MTEQQTLTPIEAINEFYRLKYKYENGYYEKYVKSIVKNNKSKREKRLEFSKLPKNECINCKRNVETIFSITSVAKEGLKIFTAKCGDIGDPCPLDIKIQYSTREQIDKSIRDGLKEIEDIKLRIIKEKNNALFFKKNVVDIFTKLTEELKIETENTGFAIETNIIRNNNPEKYALLKETINEFGKGFILPFKQIIKDFDETNDELKITQATTFYINEMIPKLKEIQSLKYDICMIENVETEKTDIYKLFQLPNSLESNEFYSKSDDKVIKFVKGIKKTTNKTKKVSSELKQKNKTKKIKPIAEIILEEEDDIVLNTADDEFGAETELENKFAENNISPIIDESGNVKWSNDEYNKLWKKLPLELKSVLLEDPEWVKDYMNNCVKLRKLGKPCELFLSKQTKFPPTKLENGQYDFNSNAVNKIFNKLTKTYQDTLLNLYTEKDGVKSYNMLKDTLASLLAKELNTNNGYL